jgi:hypothetical protein
MLRCSANIALLKIAVPVHLIVAVEKASVPVHNYQCCSVRPTQGLLRMFGGSAYSVIVWLPKHEGAGRVLTGRSTLSWRSTR